RRRAKVKTAAPSPHEQGTTVSNTPADPASAPHRPLPGQTSFLDALDEGGGSAAPDVQAGAGAGANRPLGGLVSTTAPGLGDDSGGGPRSPTSKLLSAARRVRDYQKESQGATRQLDIPLRHTPPSEVFFRVWSNPEDEFEVALLRVKDAQGRGEVYLLSPEVADLPLIAPKVRDGRLVPGITSTGGVFVWAMSVPDPNDRMGYRVHAALERVAKEARKGWVSLSWNN